MKKTQEYYRTHTLCDCSFCRNYCAQIREKFPQLDALLSEFGADAARPDETSSWTVENTVHYYTAEYTICGKIEAMDGCEIDLPDEPPLSIVVTDGYACPNEQTGDYFTLSAMLIELPWVLDEPFPETSWEKRFRRIKEFFGRLRKK